MAQVKVFGLHEAIDGKQQQLSDAIQKCLVTVFGLPETKRYHRFFPMEPQNFIFPDDRSANYLILELNIFEGRSIEAKRRLIYALYDEFERTLNVQRADLEITLFENPQVNWGIRGMSGDELNLPYRINV